MPKNNSIEELFLGLVPYLSKHSKVTTLEVPCSGGSPSVIIKNLNFTSSKKDQINHVTGDIHYLVLALGKRSVLTIHDVHSALDGNFFKKIYTKLFWFWLPALFVKRITVISKFTKSELERVIPFAKNKIRVIHNPINNLLKLTPYQFNSKSPKILFIGTKPNKNLEQSIRAIKDLNCKAIIIGKLTNDQKKLLEQYHIVYENKFNLTYKEIVACYQTCDLVCFISTYEGFGMPIIEAQAIGRPIITSNFGAMREVSSGSACEVDPNDVNAIKENIEKIFEDEQYRQQLIKDGLHNVKRFQPELIAGQYIDLYKEVLTL